MKRDQRREAQKEQPVVVVCSFKPTNYSLKAIVDDFWMIPGDLLILLLFFVCFDDFWCLFHEIGSFFGISFWCFFLKFGASHGLNFVAGRERRCDAGSTAEQGSWNEPEGIYYGKIGFIAKYCTIWSSMDINRSVHDLYTHICCSHTHNRTTWQQMSSQRRSGKQKQQGRVCSSSSLPGEAAAKEGSREGPLGWKIQEKISMTRMTARMHVDRKGALQEHVHVGQSSSAVDSDLVAEPVSSDSGLGCHFRVLLSLAVLIALALAGLLGLNSAMELESMPVRLHLTADVVQDEETDVSNRIQQLTNSEEAAGSLKSLLHTKTQDAQDASEQTETLSATDLWVNDPNESHQSTNMSPAVRNQSHMIETSRRLAEDHKPSMNFDIITERFQALRNHNFRLFPVFRRRPFCFAFTILALMGILSVLGCMVPGGMHGVGRSHSALAILHT